MVSNIWYIFLFILVLGFTAAAAETSPMPWHTVPMDKAGEELALSMNSLEFGKWASDELKDSIRTKAVSLRVIGAYLARLKHSRVVPARLATNIATNLKEAMNAEGNGELLSKEARLGLAVSFLDEVYAGSKDQPLVRSEAADSICEYLAQTPESNEKALSIHLEILKERTKLILELTAVNQNDHIEAAAILARKGEKEAAEALITETVSYPWYLLHDGAVVQKFRDYYIRAMLLLIDIRRGDLQRLKELQFSIVPAAKDFVLPELERAISEAGNATSKATSTSKPANKEDKKVAP